MDKNLRCRFGSLVFFLAVCTSAKAQEDAQAAYLDAMADAGMRTWRMRIKPEFTAVADVETKRVLESVRFNIGRYADFNAFSSGSGGAPRILIPMGLLIGNDFVASNAVFVLENPSCNKYLGPALNAYKEAYSAYARSGRSINVRPVWARCGYSDKAAKSLFEKKEIYDLRIRLMVDALAMVVGHELGHLVKRHRGYSEISKEEAWRQENEADDFGFRLAKNSGFNPSAALITTYSFFTVLEGTRYGGHYHPPASCRIVELSDKYVLKEENQTGNGRTLATESNGTRERSKFLEALKPLREDCLSTKS